MDFGFADHLFDFDYKCILINVLMKFQLYSGFYQKIRKNAYPKINFDSGDKKTDKQKYKPIEVNRPNLTERVAVNGHVTVKNVIFNANENKVLFHTIIDQVITDKDPHHVKIYDPNKQDFTDWTFLYNERCKVIISYANHNEHQDGVITCFCPRKNEISTFCIPKL